MKDWPNIFRLRDMIGEKLLLLEGRRGISKHPSEGFHMEIAKQVPEPIIQHAIRDTNDAFMRSRGPDGTPLRNAGAYFAGVVRNLCAEQRIETTINWGGEPVPLAKLLSGGEK